MELNATIYAEKEAFGCVTVSTRILAFNLPIDSTESETYRRQNFPMSDALQSTGNVKISKLVAEYNNRTRIESAYLTAAN